MTDYYYGPGRAEEFRDGLRTKWHERVRRGTVAWCNPPYSRGSIVQWCLKAEQEAMEGVTTVMLLPGDTSTEYFHQFVLKHEHYFIQRRLKFEGAPLDSKGRLAAAKFGSVLVVFRPEGPWTRG